ncbi:MAG: ribulose-phosphate 3-epimerase [Pseudomonadota bacterium]
MKRVKISPSILSSDFANLGHELRRITEAGADMVHIDVMDGHFVPNITIGPSVIKALRSSTTLPFDVHLMIENPERYIEEFAAAGADIITVHYEAIEKTEAHISILSLIKSHGCKAGISLIPSTPSSVLTNLLDHLDLILIMTVNPGFSGQAFMHEQLPKIRQVSEMVKDHNIMVEVDGGINDSTAQLAIDAGADILVSGSYIFGATDMRKSIEALRGG